MWRGRWGFSRSHNPVKIASTSPLQSSIFFLETFSSSCCCSCCLHFLVFPNFITSSTSYAISLIALVSSGKTEGSESMGKHAMGPLLWYNLRNLCRGSPCSRSFAPSAILMTTSGLRRPCAVWNDGRVSLAASTEGLMAGRAVEDRRGELGRAARERD